MTDRNRLLSSAIAAAAVAAAGLLLRSMVKAVSAPDVGSRHVAGDSRTEKGR